MIAAGYALFASTTTVARATGILWLVAAVSVACGGDGARKQPPDIILISIDTLRPDFLGAYGYSPTTSPGIDALAAGGVLFEDATSSAPWTLPAHASLLTGLSIRRHGVVDHDRALRRPGIAHWLREAGWQTLAIVNSAYLGEPRFGLLEGFERTHFIEDRTQRPLQIHNSGAKVTARAIAWLKRRDRERPTFLLLHYYDPHSDYTPNPAHRERFVGPYQGPLDGSTQQLLDVRYGRRHLDRDDLRWLEEMYAAEVRTLDDHIATLLRFLHQSAMASNTLVVLTADHGEAFGEHGGVLHGDSQYQEQLAIPLIMRGPGVPADCRERDPAHLVDVAPTVLGLAGVAIPQSVEGRDLSRWWCDATKSAPSRALFASADKSFEDDRRWIDVKRMVRFGRWKLHVDLRDDSRRLYDLRSDPGEQRDIASANAAVVRTLEDLLEAHERGSQTTEEIGDPSGELRARLEALGYIHPGE